MNNSSQPLTKIHELVKETGDVQLLADFMAIAVSLKSFERAISTKVISLEQAKRLATEVMMEAQSCGS